MIAVDSGIDTPEDVFARFESRTNLERTTPQLRMYRLERMVALLERLGNPQHRLPVAHLAGSKGKGSTAAYLTSLLAASGRRVGLYTSPHVLDYRERFSVTEPYAVVGGPADGARDAASDTARDTTMVQQGRRVWAVVEQMTAAGVAEDELPTTFELLTALAFCYFHAAGCDWIVLETGLGGRLDATNVSRPRATLITRIELEHTEYLGDTLALIAGEKAGIIKERVPLLLSPQHPDADAVFRRVAGERHAPVIDVLPLPDAGDPAGEVDALSGSVVQLPSWAGDATVRLSMLGAVHRTNTAMALAAYRRLVAGGEVPMAGTDSITAAIAGTRLPGRGEVVGDVILDGAHTAESAAALAETLLRRMPAGRRIPIILGVVAGKNVEAIARALAPLTTGFVVSRPGRFKPGDPGDVARRIAAAGYAVERRDDPAEALALARERLADGSGAGLAGKILVSGSFYMVAEVRRLVVE